MQTASHERAMAGNPFEHIDQCPRCGRGDASGVPEAEYCVVCRNCGWTVRDAEGCGGQMCEACGQGPVEIVCSKVRCGGCGWEHVSC